MYPRLRPHWLQRRTTRDLNFGTRNARMITDFRAINVIYTMGLSHRESVTYPPYNPAISNLPRIRMYGHP
jgi:hypothetical protein